MFSRCCGGPWHGVRSELWDQGRLKWGFTGLNLTGMMQLPHLTKSIRHSPGFHDSSRKARAKQKRRI